VVRAQDIIGLSVTEWSRVLLVSGAVSVILGIPAGRAVDLFNKKNLAGACMVLGAVESLLFLRASSFTHVALLAVATTVTNSFMNPAFQSLFADMTPRENRGRVLASIGGGGVWLMRGAWGSGVLGMSLQTVGTFLSGYLYQVNPDLPWLVLSGALLVLGVLFVVLVEEPEVAEE